MNVLNIPKHTNCTNCGKEMELSDAYYREVTAKEQELK